MRYNSLWHNVIWTLCVLVVMGIILIGIHRAIHIGDF